MYHKLIFKDLMLQYINLRQIRELITIIDKNDKIWRCDMGAALLKFKRKEGVLIKRKILTIVSIISLILVIISLRNIVIELLNYYRSASKYEVLRNDTEEKEKYSYDRLSKLKKINNEYVGWIKIEDTNIDYPVTKAVDNAFYLSHNFYKELDNVGSIFMDYQNSINELDKNIVIYGVMILILSIHKQQVFISEVN